MNVVFKTSPLHTEAKVALDKVIEMYFMIDINTNTLKSENIILFNMTEQSVEPITHEYVRRILKVSPVNKLHPNNHYQLQLVGGENGIKDITGRAMTQTYELEFHTKDVEGVKPPKILAPTDLSVVRDLVLVQLEPNLDVDYYELQVSKSNTFQNLVWPLNGEKVYRTSEVSVIPDVAYETGSYYLRARSVDFEGLASAWSPTIRYYYDGAPIIQLPEEEPIPDETVEPETPVDPEAPEEDVTASSRRIILQAKSTLKSEPDQLSKLQNVFSAKEGTVLTGVYVKSATPRDKSVHNTLSKFNGTRQIIIEFTEDIDPATVTDQLCYVLAERN